MRIAILALGFLATMGLVAISIAMNFRFGYMLGATEFDGYVYGAASACADIFKSLLPFCIAWAWAHRQVWAVTAGIVLAVIFTGYSMTSSLGFSAINRAGTEAVRAAPLKKLQAARDDLKETVAKIDALSPARGEADIAREITQIKQDKRWRSTAGCTDATARLSIAFCDGHKRLVAELGVARQRATLEARRKDQQASVDRLMASGVVSDTDPQAGLLAKITGVNRDYVKTGLTVLIAVLVELGSSLGFFVLFSSGRAPPQSRTAKETAAPMEKPEPEKIYSVPTQPVATQSEQVPMPEQWVRDRIEQVEGASEVATALYEDFQAWAARTGAHDMTFTAFGRWLGDQGFDKSKIGGRMRYTGVQLLPKPGHNVVHIKSA